MESSAPSQVKLAVNLVWLTLAIGIFRTIWRVPTAPPKIGMAFFIIVFVMTFALMAFINSKILAGRNWARILTLILFLLGLPFSLLQLGREFSQSIVDGSAAILQIGLQAAALSLVFLTAGKEWFAKRNSEAIDRDPKI